MRKLMILGLVGLAASAAAPPAGATDSQAQAAFARLKSLAGSWRATAGGEGEAAADEVEPSGPVPHTFRVSAAGTVVMETMASGTDYEMINMYHVDGDDLLVTHYCAGGNQPRLRLDRASSTADELRFSYLDGTNLDPSVDEHIHAITIDFVDADHVESAWSGNAGGKPAGVMTFHLTRSQ